MAFSLSGLLRTGARVAGRAMDNPLVQTGMSFIPGGPLGRLAAKGAAAYLGYKAIKGIGNAMSGGAGGQPPMPPGAPGSAMVPYGGGHGNFLPSIYAGKRSLFKNDPNIAENLKQYAIDNRFLKMYYRAPRGYVCLKDAVGDTYAIPRAMAMHFGLWRPSPKPFITHAEHHTLVEAKTVINKMKRMAKTAKFINTSLHGHRNLPEHHKRKK